MVMASTPAPRRSARARRPPQRLADSAMFASTSARRRTARARRPLPRRRSARGPEAPTGLHDEIWEVIFLRLDAAADVARASAACFSFHRIISERRFLRRFQSLHSPAVLGFISTSGDKRFFPVRPPHRSAPESRALEQAADFTFSFLPDPSAWRFLHAHDGRVLLARSISDEIEFEDLVVCDPLHRRYVMIPRIPDDLMASAGVEGRHLVPVLAPAGENDVEESFRVICPVLCKDEVMAFVFSSCNQTWRGIITTICLPTGLFQWVPYYAHDCLYWMARFMGYSLMLDTSEMKFSIIDLPPHNFYSKRRAIFEAADGRLGFLTVGDGTIDLYCKNWQSNCVGAQKWMHDKLIPLPKDYEINYIWETEGTAGHYIALAAYHESSSKTEHFVLDIKTLLVENLCTSKNGNCVFFGLPYARFPPPLALPSI